MVMHMSAIKKLIKDETVFCASLLLAALSCLAVRPDMGYLSYPDYRTLSLLFCLMIVVAGFRSLGVFTLLGEALIRRAGNVRTLSAAMVLLCFFLSMVITNDVTLLTFVPFTILVFRLIGREERILKLVVLETIAANLGSMATPIGNPQNLYLYSVSGMSAGSFAASALPYAALSLLMLLAALMRGRDEPLCAAVPLSRADARQQADPLRCLPYVLLLALCLLVVFRILPYVPVLLCVAAVIFVVNRRLYLSVDYFLLLTFLCFFVFIGNLKRIPALSGALSSLTQGHELLAGILASQFISNVPAAILLSGFTDDFSSLLTGVNLGGLGTLIASLASLISFKFFAREYPGGKGRFLKEFTLWNLAFLLCLSAEAALLL